MLTESVLIEPVLDHATGSATRDSATVDMRGYLGAVVTLHLGTVAAGADHTAKLQGSNDGTTWTDLAGWSFAINGAALSDTVAVVDVHRPRHRYLRVVLTKDGSNNSAESATVARYKAQREPVAVTDPLQVSVSQLHAPENA